MENIHIRRYLIKDKIDRIMAVIGVLGYLASVPTVIKVWFTQPTHASGQSLTTWGLWTLFSFLWLLYGLRFKLIAIWLSKMVDVLLCGAICAGILVHAGFIW